MIVNFFSNQLSVHLDHIYKNAYANISKGDLNDFDITQEVEKYKIDLAKVPSFDDSDIQVFLDNTINASAQASQMSFDISFSGDEKWFEFSVDSAMAPIPNASADNQKLVVTAAPNRAFGVLNTIKREVGKTKISLQNFNNSLFERIMKEL